MVHKILFPQPTSVYQTTPQFSLASPRLADSHYKPLTARRNHHCRTRLKLDSPDHFRLTRGVQDHTILLSNRMHRKRNSVRRLWYPFSVPVIVIGDTPPTPSSPRSPDNFQLHIMLFLAGSVRRTTGRIEGKPTDDLIFCSIQQVCQSKRRRASY